MENSADDRLLAELPLNLRSRTRRISAGLLAHSGEEAVVVANENGGLQGMLQDSDRLIKRKSTGGESTPEKRRAIKSEGAEAISAHATAGPAQAAPPKPPRIDFFNQIPKDRQWRMQTFDDLQRFFRREVSGNAALLQSPPGWGKSTAVEQAALAAGALYARVIGGLHDLIEELTDNCFDLVKAHLDSTHNCATVGEVRVALRGTVESCVAALAAECQQVIDAAAPDQVQFDVEAEGDEPHISLGPHPVTLTGRASGPLVFFLDNMECLAVKGPADGIQDSAPASQKQYKACVSLEFGRAMAALCDANPRLRVVYAVDISNRANALVLSKEVELAPVAQLQASQPADVQLLLEHYFLHRATLDVDWRGAAARLAGPPMLACLGLRFVNLRDGEALTQKKLEAFLDRAEEEYRKEIGDIFHLYAGFNRNLRKILASVWGVLRESEADCVVLLPDTRPEGWEEVEASGILKAERVGGEGDVVRVYPCLKALLEKVWVENT